MMGSDLQELDSVTVRCLPGELPMHDTGGRAEMKCREPLSNEDLLRVRQVKMAMQFAGQSTGKQSHIERGPGFY